MVQRRRGSPEVSFFHRSPEFFEVYLPDCNSQQLCIPPAFVKHFEGKIPEKAMLKDVAGKCWHVDLKEEGNGLFFKNGWQRFVDDNSLKIGEFMIFRYNKSSTFIVRIFGTSGCKKENTLAVEKITSIKIEDEPKPESYPVDKQQKCSEMPNKRPFESKPAGLKEDSFRARRTIMKNVEANQDVDGKAIGVPKKLCFVTAVSMSKPSQLHIPKRLLTKYGIKLGSKVLLRNQNGKSWEARILHTPDGRKKLSDGWLEFCKDNGVTSRDKIELNFILSERRMCKGFGVYVTSVREGARHH